MRKAYVFWAVGGSAIAAGFVACGTGPQQTVRVDVRVQCTANEIRVIVKDPIEVRSGQSVEWRLIPRAAAGAPGVQDSIVITPKDSSRWVFRNNIAGTRDERDPAVGNDAQGEADTYGYTIWAQCTRGNRPTMEVTLDPDLILDDPGTPSDSIPN